MEFSLFGEKFTRHAGITQLMDDLNQGLTNPDAIMLGGGNPAPIPAMLERFQAEAKSLLDNGELVKAMANYDGPQGKDRFTKALAALLSKELGWDISARNIALTNGSQNAFFYLFNLLAGEFADGRKKKVLFPLAPEYIGYADSALADDYFVAYKPTIEKLPDGQFKYHVDFEIGFLGNDEGVAAVASVLIIKAEGRLVS
jgi:valine--pyruvate aminotransferase